MGQAKTRKRNAIIPAVTALRPLSEDESQEVQAAPTVEGVIAAEKALKKLRSRSFSERNQHLGKMKNCKVCGLRHREHDSSCSGKQEFAHRWDVDNEGNKVYTPELLIAGQTPETETVFEERKIRLFLGAKHFAKKRRKPHPNQQNLIFIELVRNYTPYEYTQEDLNKARQRARRELGLNKIRTRGCIPAKNAYGYRIEVLDDVYPVRDEENGIGESNKESGVSETTGSAAQETQLPSQQGIPS